MPAPAQQRPAPPGAPVSPLRGWTPLVLLPPLALLATPADWPRWAVMWTLAFAIFCACKWLTWRRSTAGWASAPAWRHLGYFAAWPGLDPVSFLGAGAGSRRAATPTRPAPAEWLFATGKTLLGVVFIYALAPAIPEEQPYVVGWAGMVGIVLVLHFGVFHLLSCAWRQAGVEARPLMDWPLAAVSLGEFWGRRWNTAFRDLTHRFLFRPLVPRIGAPGAVFAGFVFSGLVHDAVISLPAGGGYGGPTLYFLIQGLGILAERSKPGRALGLGAGRRGWFFTLAALVLPAPLLFHRPFVEEVVVPFLGAILAI